jgi:threonine dehydratase
MKQQRPDIRLVGVQVLAAPSMARALEGGSPVDVDIQTTIADGIAVKKAGALTMPIIQKLVDDIVLVSEEEVALSIVTLLERCKLLVEGAGAVSLAAVLHRKLALRSGERVVCLLSGGNIDVRTIATVVERGLLAAGRYLQLRVELVDAPGALSRLASALATVKANINEIKHDRRTRDLMLGETAVELVLETRGREHGAEIIEQLRALGYRVHAA